MPSRSAFLASATVLACGPSLSACASSDSAYAEAVAKTWRPFDTSLSERRALQRELIRYASLAPSSHNTQCWKFGCDADTISIYPDFTRRCPAVDPDDHHLYVSLGCATENLVQGGRANGLYGRVRFDPSRADAVTISFERAKPIRSALFDAIPVRQVTRGAYDGRSLEPAELRALEAAARGPGVEILLLTARPKIERVLEYVLRGNTLQMHDAAFMNELRSWIRFNDAEAIAKGDGLSTRASGSQQLPRWLGSAALKLFFTAKSENEKYARYIRSSAGIAVFVSAASDKQHWVETGRCFERFVLQATALGIRTAMVNQPVEVSALRPDFARALGIGARRPDLVVRFGRGPEMPRSLRRPVDDIVVA